MLRDEEICSGKCWTDGEWENHLLLEETIGGMLTAKLHVFSGSVFCTGPEALDPTSALTFLEKKAEAVIKSDNCRNRSDIVGETINIEMARMYGRHDVADTAKASKHLVGERTRT